MDWNVILQSISTVGFPIVMCIILFLHLQKTNEKHAEEIAGLRDAINNNTVVMNKVLDKME